MKPFSIAAVQLNLEYTNNFNLLERKTREVVARFPWVQMVVLSELAAGGTSKNVEHSLEKYLPKLKSTEAIFFGIKIRMYLLGALILFDQ